MTTPVEATVSQTVSIATVDELIAQANRLGLTWGLRPATVVDTFSSGGPYNPRILMDGDTPDTTMLGVSLIGGLAVHMRVMVMFVPPMGYYIIGIISTDDIARVEVGGFANHATGITSTETVLETFIQFTALPGAAYRVDLGGWLLSLDTVFTTFRFRKTSTAGQIIASTGSIPGVGLGTAPLYYAGYFVNNSGVSITENIVLTAATGGGGGSTWGADAGRPRYASIQYAGPAIEYPFATPYV